jgi:urease accessory protein
VINKIDLAPMVGASLAVMEADTERMRGGRPWCFTNIRTGEGLENVEAFLRQQLPGGNG